MMETLIITALSEMSEYVLVGDWLSVRMIGFLCLASIFKKFRLAVSCMSYMFTLRKACTSGRYIPNA